MSNEHNGRDIDQAASAAVKKVFAILGVNVDEPKEVEEFREDLRFGKRMRKLSESGIMTVWLGVITMVLSGFVAVFAGIFQKH